MLSDQDRDDVSDTLELRRLARAAILASARRESARIHEAQARDLPDDVLLAEVRRRGFIGADSIVDAMRELDDEPIECVSGEWPPLE